MIEGFVELIQIAACIFIIGFGIWSNLSPRFNDGIVLKVGTLILALAATADIANALIHQDTVIADLIANVGICFVYASMCWRRIVRVVWPRVVK